jgi:hypothetical protein
MFKSPRWLTGLFVIASFLGSGVAGATSASPAPGVCLDNAVVGYVTGGPANAYLPSASGTYRTTSRCQDVNFSNRSGSGNEAFQALIRVCFVAAGYCQSSWKYYYTDAGHGWMVIASNVKDGTTFRLEFQFYESTFGSSYGNLIAF